MRKFLLWIQILWATASFAQPTGSCTTGTTKMGTDDKFYGCVEGSWKRLSEQDPYATYVNNLPVGILLYTGMDSGYLRAVERLDNGSVQLHFLKNEGFTPIALTGHTHEVGKVIYDTTKKHFYEGVSGGLWHQIDNQVTGGGGGGVMYGWHWFSPGTPLHEHYFCNSGDNLVPSPGMWIFNPEWRESVDGEHAGWGGCQCIVQASYPEPPPEINCGI